MTRERTTLELPDGSPIEVWMYYDKDGVNWLDLTKDSPSNFYIAVDDEGNVVSITDDASMLQIHDLEMVGIDTDFGLNEDTVLGKIWDGSAIVEAPVVEEIKPLTARQLRLGLVSNGILLSQVEATIDAIESQQERDVARIEWEYASTFDRNHPLIEQVGGSLGLTVEQIDAMWLAASTL
ncbi:hypothetical protein DKP76_11440 [Falsochrobactrum shanghaiense]|uniref:Uncharacterized protein n=2 Tax=Falsochrobactrum shanghaiense TaxID=2201899 RepID=A0A316J6R0_9HYPH|nr:hypothetical protein DKP76_11440 [Falsochrobactrum shanghaiense]